MAKLALAAVMLLFRPWQLAGAMAEDPVGGRVAFRPRSSHARFDKSGIVSPPYPAKPRRSRRMSFLQSHSHSQEVAPLGRVLYFMYSDSKFYNTRLTWVFDTWGKKVPLSNFNIVGDAPYTLPVGINITTTSCEAHSHWEGACCKYAEAVLSAYAQMQADESISWAYFLDDDTYVRTELLEDALAQEEDAGNNGLAVGNMGCHTPECSFSICGGGGYALNRRAVFAAIADDPKQFKDDAMLSCSMCGNWADAAITQVYDSKNIEFRELHGLYGWKMIKKHFDLSLNKSYEPIMYHYVQSSATMNFLHHLFSGGPGYSNATAIEQHADEVCTYYHNKRECAKSDDPAHWPWLRNDDPTAKA